MYRKANISCAWRIMLCLLLIPVVSISHAQVDHPLPHVHFYSLTTSEGLTDNYIRTMAVDRSGFLWVGTGEGLNRFNGKTVEKYFALEYPSLVNNNIRQLVCDAKNRIWVLTAEGHLTLIDENRKLHRVGLYAGGKFDPTRRILTTSAHGVIILTRHHHLMLKPQSQYPTADTLSNFQFDTLAINGADSIYNKFYTSIEKFRDNEYLFTTPTYMLHVDYAAGVVKEKIPLPGCRPLCTWEGNKILAFDEKHNTLLAIDPTNLDVTYPFAHIRDQHNQPIGEIIYNASQINPDLYIITSRYDGVYAYEPSTQHLINYRHNAADPTTVINNSPDVITSDSTGWIFLGATPHGVSYYNLNAVIGEQLIFQDDHGNSYDGYITNLTSADNTTFYIGTNTNLIEWNRNTNHSVFHTFPLPGEKTALHDEEIMHVTFDRLHHLWVITRTSGIYVFTPEFKLIHHFRVDDSPGTIKFIGIPTHVIQGIDKRMWVCGTKGIFTIDPIRFTIDSLVNTPLHELAGLYVSRTISFDSSSIWIATAAHGAWHYDLKTNQVTKYNKRTGYKDNQVFTIQQDSHGNIYFGTSLGLQIIFPDGKTKFFDDSNGLLNTRVEALLRDQSDRMWIGNDVGLACFNIADTSMRVFDERYGLSIQGFRLNSYFQASSDELFWGTERGLQYFYPDDLLRQKIDLRTTIYQLETRDIDSYLTQSAHFTLRPGNSFVSFSFATIDYYKHLHTFYQYQLTGIDPEWINAADQNSVRYNSLKPGDYTFRVRASNDRKNWVNAENEISFTLEGHFWTAPWFKWLMFSVAACGIALFIRVITRRQKQRTEELETESVINYFASQINRHQHTDDMLWDVAKNCISRLNLEECVIYLLDPVRQVLVQKAAYGPKNPKENTILKPIEIPMGQGITGHVALTRKAEIINNTDKDPRYIVDDDRRLAEMAVPIVMDDKTIGVIDSEHTQRNYFTPKHLSLMSTIAILTANQIQRILAEEEKQKAEIEVLQNKQKATESRLQSLRLQMNPHFLFNALNSIQQMILANEEMVATRYLSRFSKLLRSILIHSDKEMISLKEELDILRLYVELESVRFKDAFTYDIHCDDTIDEDEVKIPTLLIQPFVENAIWHGLMHKEGMRNLTISFTEEDDYIRCIVEDNGIGRQKAKELKISTGQDKNHTSKGIAVSLERLKAMQKNGGAPGSMQIHDLVDAQGHPVGTRIEIHLPIQN